MKLLLKSLLCTAIVMASIQSVSAIQYGAGNVSATLSLKVPGNPATAYPLALQNPGSDGRYALKADKEIPATLYQQVTERNGEKEIRLVITAQEDIYFNYIQQLNTGFSHDDCLFYLPGFWYRRNLRSPEEAPSFHTADSWTVREDRLSTPLSGVFNEKNGDYVTVLRIDDFKHDALTTHKEGEVIISGKTSVGAIGFENQKGQTALVFGFPYQENPKSYTRKLTLAPSIEAYQFLKKGEKMELTWRVRSGNETEYSQFITQTWKYSYDAYTPEVVNPTYSTAMMKEVLSNYFIESFVDKYELKYTSGAHIRTDLCEQAPVAEVGFIGRVLLNAFNALEYGESTGNEQLVKQSRATFDSYLEKGFTDTGFFREYVDFRNIDDNPVLSIRRQSEGAYALLLFLQYEKKKGRKHPEWEQKIRQLLDKLVQLQQDAGSFPRKFKGDFTLVDESTGSTPSATVPLVLGYTYFKDKNYLNAGKKSVAYLERELISTADYFSSTLDADCEDKEASYYAAVATYYMALVSKGKEKEHYISLCQQATYFAASWYYLWDVPFAQGQMLGDIGLKSRGWGNVSVENNHIDVFIFELAYIMEWLSNQGREPRFADLSKVITTSMRQLLPFEGHMCGIGKVGYYPEVVQHTNWDYGKNGKGFYNDIFAPGWTVASLWELLSPGRMEQLFGFDKK